MSNYARIIGNVAVDVSATPAAHFHPLLAVEFVEVPAEVRPGWRRDPDSGDWAAPAAAPAEAQHPADPADPALPTDPVPPDATTPRRIVSVGELRKYCSLDELVKFDNPENVELLPEVPAVDRLKIASLNRTLAGLTEGVDLEDPATAAMLQYLEAVGVLDAPAGDGSRAEEILAAARAGAA